MTGNPNAQQLLKDLVASGLSAGAAAGVVGNIMAESSANPRAVGDNGLARGIAQWHPDRWNNLVAMAKANGQDPYSLQAQETFLIAEAKQLGVWQKLQGEQNAITAAGIWMRLFERPADQSDANARRRAGLGVAVLGTMGETGGGNAITGAITGAIQGASGAINSTTRVFDGLLWWFNPGHVLRVVVGAAGAVLIVGGLILLSREVRT